LAALAAVGASCLTVAACGGGAPAASASASVNPDPLASLSASVIAAKAIVNLKAASSLTMDGSLLDSGQPITVSLGIKPGEGCAGSIDMDTKGSFKFILIGKTVYLNPDDNYWEANAGSNADAIIKLVDGRYIKSTTSGATGGATLGVIKLCDLSQVAGSIKVNGTITKGKLTTLGGVKVLPLIQGTDGTLWVTDTAKPELIKVESTYASGDSTVGVVTFSPGAPVTLTAPPADQVIDAAKLDM
jgi:hypothetical protein